MNPRRTPERGATLVETSIVALLVFTMLLAIFEFGLLFRDNLTATDAVADATRIGAIIGPDVSEDGTTADYAIVRALREGMSSMNDTAVRWIVVFNATGTSGPAEDRVPVQCRNGRSWPGLCNAYPSSAAFAAVEAGGEAAAYFSCGDGDTPASKVSCNWDPSSRNAGPASDEIDTLGVYVLIERSGYTGLFADSWTISRTSIARLEPGVTD